VHFIQAINRLSYVSLHSRDIMTSGSFVCYKTELQKQLLRIFAYIIDSQSFCGET
jgi:hypothetical protein